MPDDEWERFIEAFEQDEQVAREINLRATWTLWLKPEHQGLIERAAEAIHCLRSDAPWETVRDGIIGERARDDARRVLGAAFLVRLDDD